MRDSDVATLYVCNVVFKHWCRWEIAIRVSEECGLGIVIRDSSASSIRLGSVLRLSSSEATALLQRIFPLNAIPRLRASSGESLRDIHGFSDWLDNKAVSVIFWILSGEAEASCGHRDIHGRVPALHFVLNKLNILDLPVVDLLADYIIERVRSKCPELSVPVSGFQIVPTHDVDAPYKYAFRNPLEFVRGFLGDTLRGNSVANLAKAPFQFLRVRDGDIKHDPFNSFSRIHSINEAHGLRSEFYFIAGHSGGRIDGDYELAHPLIRNLLKEVVDRGHKIGLHSSFNAPYNPKILIQELHRLQALALLVGYREPVDLVRNHYLRFDPRITPGVLDACGFKQDSTLSFADKAGFRRGTCRSFPLWDLEKKQQLNIIERPLIAMECSLISTRYQGLGYDAAAEVIDRLKLECRRFGGHMVLLWHNNYLCTEMDFELYKHALS